MLELILLLAIVCVLFLIEPTSNRIVVFQALCTWDPDKRPTAAKVLQHPFFKVRFLVTTNALTKWNWITMHAYHVTFDRLSSWHFITGGQGNEVSDESRWEQITILSLISVFLTLHPSLPLFPWILSSSVLYKFMIIFSMGELELLLIINNLKHRNVVRFTVYYINFIQLLVVKNCHLELDNKMSLSIYLKMCLVDPQLN